MLEHITTNVRLITAPAVEPVSLAEAREHLRLIPEGSPATHPDDDLIEALITAARQHLDGKDGWLNRALITQTWELVMDTFPSAEIRIPLPPLQSVSAIYYDDENGDQQTVSSADYRVDTVSEPGWIVPVSGFSWPTTLDAINAVRVRFVAGYGVNASDVPFPIKAAIKIMLGHLYSNRELVSAGAVQEIPLTVDALLTPYRVWSFS